MSLGRGLGALITSTGSARQTRKYGATEESSDDGKIWHAPITKISPNPEQPRKNFKADELQNLADSIKKHGVLQPILVVEKNDGGYEIVAGERRWRAAGIAGLSTVPVIIKQMADQEKLEVSLIENIQRENLNPIEEAFAYSRLMEEFGLTQEDVAEKVGKSRPAIANSVRLLTLPEEAQRALMDGKINSGHARALLSLEKKEDVLSALSSMLGEKISVRELEREVAKKRPIGSSRRDPNITYLEDKLRASLGAKVTISQKGDKGTVAIQYHSKEELAGLVEKLSV